MKELVTILLLFFYSTIAFGQQEMGFINSKQGCKEQQIYVQREIEISPVDNSKYLIGFFKDSTEFNGTHLYTLSHIPHELSRGLFVIKLDSMDNFVWFKKLAESDSLNSISIQCDFEGNIICGITYRSSLHVDGGVVANLGLTDCSLIKFNSTGNIIFRKTIATTCFETINDLCIDSSNNVYFTGNYGIDTNNGINNCPTNFDSTLLSGQISYIAKVNKYGNYEWVNSYGVEIIQHISINNNALYCLGETSFTSNEIKGLFFDYNNVNYFSKCFVAKLNTQGQGMWVKKFGSNDIQSAGILNKSIITHNNRVYFTGLAASNSQNVFLFDGGPTLTGFNQVDYFIAAYDTSGNFKWNTISNSIGSEYIVDLYSDSSSNLYGVGKLNYTLRFPTDTLYSNGGDDVMVCSYDSMGNFRWAAQGGGWGADIGNGIAADTHGKLFIVGGTTSSPCFMGNDTLSPPANQSTLFFSSLDSITLQVPDAMSNLSREQAHLITVPNPADQEVVLQCNVSGEIYVYDAMGRCLFQQKTTTSPITLQTNSYPNGIYILHFRNKSSYTTQKISIQH